MATLEQVVFDGLVLNDTTNWRLQGLECPPPKKRTEWATGGDADGAALVRDPLFENREVTLRLRVSQRATMDLALTAVGGLVDKLEEAEKQLNGLDLIWTPADSTKSFTFKVLSGEITGLPISMDGDDAGWFKRSPVLEVLLTCKPFAYGTEVVGSPTSSATPVVTLTVSGVTGDVPAEGRLIVTDNATQSRRYMEWGLEQRYYNAATSLLLDSDSLTTTGTGGTGTTRAGAYDPGAAGNSVIRGTLPTAWLPVAATGNQSHVGTFRVKARVYTTGTGVVSARFAWQEGDGPYRQNPPTTAHMTANWIEVDLGIISIPEKALGTQRWQGRVEATSTVTGDTLDVDYLVFVPAGEGYGRAGNAVAALGFESMVAYDDFQSAVAAAVLNGRVAPAGGTWATSGTATDFTGVLFSPSNMAMRRSTITDTGHRFAILGATSYTNSMAEVFVYNEHTGQNWSPDPDQYTQVILRWTDSSNYLALRWQNLDISDPAIASNFRIDQVVAGVSTTLAYTSALFGPTFWWHLRLYAYTTGNVVGELRYNDAAAAPNARITGFSTAVATGGTLATGKPGFSDSRTSPDNYNRWYNNFQVGVPITESLVINSGRILEVRSDATLRADSTGTYYGSPPSYRGSRFLVPNAGDESRVSRVMVKAHRQDIEVSNATDVTDSLTAQVNYTPRYLAVPR